MARDRNKDRKKLAEFAAGLYAGIGKALGAEGGSGRPFAVFSRALSGLGPKFGELDPTSTASVTDAIAAAARHIDTLWKKLSAEPEPAVRQIFDLAASLDSFNAALAWGARSLCVKDVRTRRGAALKYAIREHQMDAGNLGFEVHQAAGLLRDALGLPVGPGFEYPTTGSGCGCGGPVAVVAASRRGVRAKKPALPAQPASVTPVAEACRILAGVSSLVARYSESMARVFQLLAMATLICDDLCTPPPVITSCAFKRTNSVDDGTNWIPTFEVTWTACCNCTCMKIWTRNESVTFDISYTAPGQIPNTRPQGKAIADRTANAAGTAEVNGYNATNFPPPPAGGGPAPAPPPFKPNPGIKPGLNAAACPAKC